MLLRDLYYLIKPTLPRRLRMMLRRRYATRIRSRSAGVWPILQEAGNRPAGWPGWPGQHRFAFVLTHDVEGVRGLEQCRRLAELEMRLGFRSSFNFVPDGDYSATAELRGWLQDHGFEVGVHDLHHNGRLYSDRAGFARKAARINQYVREWNASGFRSGFMHHNLDWLGDLDVLYDSSTFDTDPFEPQPDGVHTIFPFFVDRSAPDKNTGGQGRDGYVELPYTLPQDSTLFLILGERDTTIWQQKLAWIAEKEGMALLNSHPDYVDFDTGRSSHAAYPASWYEDFLAYVNSAHRGRFWNPLPRELAGWYRDSIAAARQDRGNA